MLTRRTTRLYRTLCFATVALLLLLGARGVQAIGSIGGGTCEEAKDGLFARGTVVYIGPTQLWDSLEHDGFLLNIIDAWVASSPGGMDFVPALGDPNYDPNFHTEAAPAYLRAVGIELGARVVLDEQIGWDVSDGMYWNFVTQTWVQGIPDYDPIFESMTVRIGDLQLGDFDASSFPQLVDFAVGTSSPFADAGFYEYNSFQDLCTETLESCHWLLVRSHSPGSIAPTTPLSLAPAQGSLGQMQYGVTMLIATDPGYEILPHGSPDVISVDPPGILTVDLAVPDLPVEWVNYYGNVVRVASTVDWGMLYCSSAVPAMSLRGGAVLVIVVLAAGILALALPRRRAA